MVALSAAERMTNRSSSAFANSATWARKASIATLSLPALNSCSRPSSGALAPVTSRRSVIRWSATCMNCLWSANILSRRLCCAGLSEVSDLAFSKAIANACFPPVKGSRNFSSPPATKPRIPVSILTMLSSMRLDSASTSYVCVFHFIVLRNLLLFNSAMPISMLVSARIAANVSAKRFFRVQRLNMRYSFSQKLRGGLSAGVEPLRPVLASHELSCSP